MNYLQYIYFTLVGLGVFLSFLRILFGPTSADRVAALDTLNVVLTGTIVFLALIFKNGLYLDIALVYGLLSFVETVVIARNLEGKK
ncbi:cation:proton antiporter [Thermosipho melanesiensis]|uniref:Multiple resistance and pH regulation protein F n=2 Tax=Thermosipho melanesiensis TaxID=46541 RepID=A6LMB4_THEM4|nr:cation:proton antiporter [Thermosipho melanesiensis]ABR31065.1 multiple resistance and pH regulation protein F [Thermosipho melanesiensis BI429]APT74159.1 cation:proton antiporter [Thermosipho melanesiensis]OOC36105.1 cation:proton antiporter [Thermosipho melanesiensis]OOC36922.1 cation:proton antiporter [Thermosipho melanesiensis]OOC37673.1 cation:proton antiporter [Thermosipho melanesiensis]